MAEQWGNTSGTNRNAGIGITGSGLIATDNSGGAATYVSGFGTENLDLTKKTYWEVVITTQSGGTSNVGVGICNASGPLSNYMGSDANSQAVYTNGSGFYNGSSTGQVSAPTFGAGAVVGIAVDGPNSKIYWQVPSVWSSSWNNSNADPANNTGGITLGPITGAIYPAYTFQDNTDAVTARFAQASWTLTVPTGFGPIDAAVPIGAISVMP
jgi:SPRY domain